MKPRHDVYLVTWVDAFDVDGAWTPADNLPNDVTLCQSVGFVPNAQPLDDYLTLVTNDDGDGNVSNGVNIPISNIVNRVKLSAEPS